MARKRDANIGKKRPHLTEPTAMTSEARIAANRLNAKKSTGPRTPAGKAAVGLNNMKHGLLSRESLVKCESEADLVNFGKRLRAQLAPVGELELLLADRIVSTAWRLRRAVALETVLLDGDSANANIDPDDIYYTWRPNREQHQLLSRYETTLERSLYKALHELQRLQAERDGQAVPLPEAVDVNVTVTGPNDADEMALNGRNEAITGESRKTDARN
jgi:hypothetical protein